MRKHNKRKKLPVALYEIVLFAVIVVMAFRCVWLLGQLFLHPEVSRDMGSALQNQVDVDSMLAQMTLREKVCQMMIVTPEQLSGGQADTACSDALRAGLQQYPVGGIILFRQNLVDRQQTMHFLSELQAASSHTLFLGVDEEGGSVSRVGANDAMGVVRLPPMGQLGQDNDPQKAWAAGYLIGSGLRELGFNLDFAPVADVNTNPQNTVIGQRAFSSDPVMATELVRACVKGFNASGILCTLKHFPGHGDTIQDSHQEAAILERTQAELESGELLPFEAGIQAGAPLVMVGHIICTAVDPSYPASLSPAVITGLLRQQMQFDGLIVTDSLQMNAVMPYQGTECAGLLALKAGCDLLLMPANLDQAVQQILDAVARGEVSESRIDESVRRILAAKYN